MTQIMTQKYPLSNLSDEGWTKQGLSFIEELLSLSLKDIVDYQVNYSA